MMYFGFFKGMKYGKCEEEFDAYKKMKNKMNKSDILNHIANSGSSEHGFR